MTTELQNAYLTVKEACQEFNISRRTLYNWFERYQIQTKKKGHKLLILQLDLSKAKDQSESQGYENRRELQTDFSNTFDLLRSALTTLQEELRNKNKVIEEYSISRTNSLLLQEAKTIEQNTYKKNKLYRVGFFAMSALTLMLLIILWSAVIVPFVTR